MTEKPTAQARATLTAKLIPTGRTIVLCELSGEEELLAMTEMGSLQGMPAQWQLLGAQVLRSLESIDGHRINSSEYTSQGIRELFSAKEWQCVVDAFNHLHRLDESEMQSFRSGFRVGVSETRPRALG